jgi:hypothetical protein
LFEYTLLPSNLKALKTNSGSVGGGTAAVAWAGSGEAGGGTAAGDVVAALGASLALGAGSGENWIHPSSFTWAAALLRLGLGLADSG